MNINRTALVLAIGIACAASAGSVHAQAKPGKTVRCWSEKGQMVCGDAMPASAATSAQREINTSGVTVGTFPRALSPSEQAAKAVTDKAAADKAAQEADEARKRLALAVSYPTEEELQRAYKSRAEAAQAAVTTAQSGLSTRRLELSRTLLRAGDAELAGKPIPKNLQNSIAEQLAQVGSAQALVNQQQAAYAAVDAELANALQQYRAAKGVPAPPAAPAATPAAATTPAKQ